MRKSLLLKKSMRCTLLFFIWGIGAVSAQAPDPLVTNPYMRINAAVNGETENVMHFTFQNLSSIPMNLPQSTRILIELSNINVQGVFNPVNITGNGSVYFNWTYNSIQNIIIGTLSAAVPPYAGGEINIAGLIVNASPTAPNPGMGFEASLDVLSSNDRLSDNNLASVYGTIIPVGTYEMVLANPYIDLVSSANGETQNALLVNFQNLSNQELSASSPLGISILLNNMNVHGMFDPNNITGNGSTFFNWTHDSTQNIIYGTLATNIPAYAGGEIRIEGLIVNQVATNPNQDMGFAGSLDVVASNDQLVQNNFASVYVPITTNPLPVEADFSIQQNNCVVQFNLVTYSESEALSAVLQRTENQRAYHDVKTVWLEGDSYTQRYYTGFDLEPLASHKTYYYRMKYVDRNGRYSYSPVQSIRANCDGVFDIVNVHPNPVVDHLNLMAHHLQINEGEPLILSIFNSTGQLVYKQKLNSQDQGFQLSIPVGSWVNGPYIIQVQGLETPLKKIVRFIKK